MAKNNKEVELQDAGDVAVELEPPQREPSELEKANAEKALLSNRLQQLEARIERAEFAGGNKNRQRVWDEQNAQDENIRYASLPSFDGKDPIINWAAVPGGYAQERNGIVVDTQSWTTETLSGEKKRIAVEDVNALVSGNGIHIQINNWQDYMNECKAIDRLRAKYQRSTRDMAAVDLKSLREEIDRREEAITVNVTLSEDMGKTYSGKTFDVLAKMLNGHR